MVVSGSAEQADVDRRREKLKLIKLVIMVLVLLPLAISYSKDKSYLTVVNRTDYYLHLIVDGQSFLYIAPEDEIVCESQPKSEFFVRAFYSPGQDAAEQITRTIHVPYYSSSTGCSYGTSSGWDCSATPERGGSALWEITADTMLVQPE